MSDTGSPALLEQFRSLAATLQQAQQEQQVKSVIVTSASPGDGKSFVAINLALTLSESYHRQRPADRRRPAPPVPAPDVQAARHRRPGRRAARPRATSRIALVQISDTLTLLPGGRPEPNPLGGLSSDRMKRIVEEATSRFDWVIVDTPPVGVLADGRVVADMMDAAILVVRAGVTQFADVQAAVETIGREHILGVVLNAADPTDIQGQGYYRHYYGRDVGDLESDKDADAEQ